MGKTQKRKVFFSEEKKQKTFIVLSRTRRQRTPKVFWFFFSKKNSLSLERLSKPGMASQMAFVFEHRSGAAVWGP
jgi:hypothetical protein